MFGVVFLVIIRAGDLENKEQEEGDKTEQNSVCVFGCEKMSEFN